MRPAESRLARAAAAAWIGAWCGCAVPGMLPAGAMLIGAMLALLGWRVSRHSQWWGPVLVALVYGSLAAARSTPPRPPASGWVEIEGPILDQREGIGGRQIIIGSEDGPWRISVPTTGIGWLDRFDERLEVGATIRVRGRVRGRRRLLASCASAVDVRSEASWSGWLAGSMTRWRGWLLLRARQRLLDGSPSGALLYALVTGDRDPLDPAFVSRLRASGLAHLAVVSGMHVGLLAAVIGAAMARLAGRHSRCRQVMAILLTALLTSVLPATAPVQRAAALLIVGWLAAMLGRGSLPSAILWLVILLLLAIDSTAARSLSFQLTVVASAAIVLAMRRRSRAPVVAAAPFLATWPLLVAITGRLSPWGIPATAVAAPALMPALLGGWAAVLAPGGSVADLGRSAGMVGAAWIDGVCRWAAAAPGSGALAAPVGGIWAPACLILLGLALLCEPGRWPLLWSVVCLMLCAWPLRSLLPHVPTAAGVMLADVGQGQALVAVGSRGCVLVDTGNAARGVRALPPLLRELGCFRLSALILSHADTDHSGAAPELIQALRPRWIGVPAGGLCDPRWLEMARRAAELGLPLEPLARGRTLEAGGVEIEVLAPPDGRQGAGNEHSVVLFLTVGGRRVLVTGDLGLAQEARLPEPGDRAPVDVLVAGHHGSRGSTGMPLLRAWQPALVGISAGRDNVHGHPHPELLARLAELHLRHWTTGRRGTLWLPCRRTAAMGQGGRTLRAMRSLRSDGG